jgi:hypothetical protein
MTQTKHFEKVESNRDRRFSMNNSPRMKLLTLCIGAALAQMASLPALADTAVGVDTVIGNAANPGYAAGIPVEHDADAPPVLRTPTGQMYSFPPLKDDVAKGQAVGGVDVGITHDDSVNGKNAKRNEYTDNQKYGLNVNNFNLSADSAAARYFTVNGGGVGRNDQFYDVTVGKYNSWKVKAFYNETQHLFTDTWKSLYSGEGTGNQTTGLAMPVAVTSATVTPVGGALGSCATAFAPCWSYGGKIYANGVALAAINGTTGTPVAAGTITTVTGAGASGATQSNMAAAIATKLAATPYSELSLIRKKTGVRGDVNLTDSVKAYASFNLEKRTGSRPFAMNDGNVSNEVAEPINYSTHDILAGLSYTDELTQANLRTSLSMFRNSIDTLNVQYALLGSAAPQGAIQHATFVLPPDNDAFNLKGEFARSLPDLWKGRFTAAASWGSNRQNDDLIAPISAAQNADLSAAGVTTLSNLATASTGATGNAGYGANSLLVSNWNTTNALSQKKAGQRIDNKLVELGLSLRPTDDLSVKGSYRFYDTANKGGYIAYNPLTAQFGRGPSTGNGTGANDVVIAPNGSGGCYTLPGFPAVPGCSSALLASGSNIPVFSQARSTRQSNYGVSADYDLDRISSLNGSVEREDFYRTFRERDKTEENKVKLGYVNRALGSTTLRVSLEKDTKRGSNYNYRTFGDLGTGLPGLDPATQVALAGQTVGGSLYLPNFTTAGTGIVTNNLTAIFNRYSYFFRKYDQANRDQKILNARLNYQVLDDLDMGFILQTKRADYPEGIYGLKKDNQDSLGVDMSYQPTFDRVVTAFYNYQKGTKVMMMNSGTATTVAVAGTLNTASSVTNCTAANLATYGYAACADTTNGIDGSRPDASRWASETTDYNNVLGLGLQEDLGFARLGVDYSFARSSTHIAYNFGPQAFSAVVTSGVLANNARMAALAGSALPDMTTDQNTITLNLVKPLDKKTTVRAMYRYDAMKLKDWHYDGVVKNAMAAYDSGTLLLDSGANSYHVNTFGVFLNYKL